MKGFTIKGRFFGDKTFPSLNNYLAEVGRNPKAGGRLKRQYVIDCHERDTARFEALESISAGDPALYLCRAEKRRKAGQREHIRAG